MQQSLFADAGGAFEAALGLEPKHIGAMVNGVHCLQQLRPDDQHARRRLAKVAQAGVAAGLWNHPMQRPPHMMTKLRSQPWHTPTDFPWCKLLEQSYAAIRREASTHNDA